MKDPDGNPFIVDLGHLVIVNYYGPGMESMPDSDLERNISAFDNQGNEVWKVSPPTVRPQKTNPYTSVFVKDGKVFGGNWCGYDFEINVADGTVTLSKNSGRPW
jgi:hypothetical protein